MFSTPRQANKYQCAAKPDLFAQDHPDNDADEAGGPVNKSHGSNNNSTTSQYCQKVLPICPDGGTPDTAEIQAAAVVVRDPTE